jgi:predicted RNA-binding protein
MKVPELEKKLTPAAREALDELVEDFRNQTLLSAAKSAARAGVEVTEISVRDILDSLNKLQLRRTQRLPTQLASFLRFYVFLGIIFTLLGFGFFLYRSISIGDIRENKSLIGAVAFGLLVSASSFILRRWGSEWLVHLVALPSPSETRSRTSDLVGEYLLTWPKIELAARDLVASRLGESSANKPLSLLLSELQDLGILKREEKTKLRDLLGIRNRIVHAGKEVDLAEIEVSLNDAEKILSKLRSQSSNSIAI